MSDANATQELESSITQELSTAMESQERRITELQGYLKFFGITFVVILLVLLTIVFRELQGVLKPLFVAIFLSYLIYPIVNFLVARRVPKVMAYLGSVVGIVSVFYVVGQLIILNVRTFIEQAGRYQVRILHWESILNELAGRYNLLPEGEPIRLLDVFSLIPQDQIARVVGGGTTFFLGFAGSVFIILIFMLFVLLEMERIPDRITIAFGEKRSEMLLEIVRDINTNVQRYIGIKVVASFFTALLSVIFMGLFGLDFFILFGAIIFFFNFIPYVGSWIATLLPVLVALLQFASPWNALWLGLCLFGVQTLIGSILEPRYHGRNLNLSPLLILVTLGFWAWLWGIIGMVLAIPIMVVLRIVLEQLDSTRPISIMMSNMGRADVKEQRHLERLSRRTEELQAQIEPH